MVKYSYHDNQLIKQIMEQKTKQGNGMMIAIIIVAVVAVGIIGYLIYDNNQKQAAAEAQIAAAQQQAAQAEAEAKQAEAEAQQKAKQTEQQIEGVKNQIEATTTQLAQQIEADTTATCAQKVAEAEALIPKLDDYSDILKELEKAEDDDPEAAIEKCREIHEGLSKNECEDKVEKFIEGNEDLQDEIETEIEELNAIIAAGC
jgi:type II secretory pathway component PulJ